MNTNAPAPERPTNRASPPREWNERVRTFDKDVLRRGPTHPRLALLPKKSGIRPRIYLWLDAPFLSKMRRRGCSISERKIRGVLNGHVETARARGGLRCVFRDHRDRLVAVRPGPLGTLVCRRLHALDLFDVYGRRRRLPNGDRRPRLEHPIVLHPSDPRGGLPPRHGDPAVARASPSSPSGSRTEYARYSRPGHRRVAREPERGRGLRHAGGPDARCEPGRRIHWKR